MEAWLKVGGGFLVLLVLVLVVVLELGGKIEDEDEHDDEDDSSASPDFNHTRGKRAARENNFIFTAVGAKKLVVRISPQISGLEKSPSRTIIPVPDKLLTY